MTDHEPVNIMGVFAFPNPDRDNRMIRFIDSECTTIPWTSPSGWRYCRDTLCMATHARWMAIAVSLLPCNCCSAERRNKKFRRSFLLSGSMLYFKKE